LHWILIFEKMLCT